MPFKSKAQQRFMFAAEARGELPQGTARRWAHHTKNIKKLPEKVSMVAAPAAPAVAAMKPPAAPLPGAAAPAAMTPPASQPMLSPRAKLALEAFRLSHKHQQPALRKLSALLAQGRSMAEAMCLSYPEKSAEQLMQAASALVKFALAKEAEATPSTKLPAPAKSQMLAAAIKPPVKQPVPAAIPTNLVPAR